MISPLGSALTKVAAAFDIFCFLTESSVDEYVSVYFGKADLKGFRGRSKEGGNGFSNDARGTMMSCSVNEPGRTAQRSWKWLVRGPEAVNKRSDGRKSCDDPQKTRVEIQMWSMEIESEQGWSSNIPTETMLYLAKMIS